MKRLTVVSGVVAFALGGLVQAGGGHAAKPDHGVSVSGSVSSGSGSSSSSSSSGTGGTAETSMTGRDGVLAIGDERVEVREGSIRRKGVVLGKAGPESKLTLRAGPDGKKTLLRDGRVIAVWR